MISGKRRYKDIETEREKNEKVSRLERENLQIYGHKYTDIGRYRERDRNVDAETQKYGFISTDTDIEIYRHSCVDTDKHRHMGICMRR